MLSDMVATIQSDPVLAPVYSMRILRFPHIKIDSDLRLKSDIILSADTHGVFSYT